MKVKQQKEGPSNESSFLMLLLVIFVVIGVTFKNVNIAMWVGFCLAGYSVVANDSIQTIGTFIASNKHRKWWVLWGYIGLIFLATHLYGWFTHGGDVSYGRLAAKGFEKTPESFEYLQVAAPVFLLILTKLKMPVSTTFLVLSSFANTASTVSKILFKSLLGYFVAFITSMLCWPLIKKALKKYGRKEASKGWVVAQWVTSGVLWSVWLMQDAANVAVFLPRSLSVLQVTIFSVYMVGALGLLMWMKGGKIQQVVQTKTKISDVRHATIVDGIYACILYYFKMRNKLPMSTTWVFLGNLGGRELGLSLVGEGKSYKKTRGAILKDISYASIGLVISLLIAIAVNPAFKQAFLP